MGFKDFEMGTSSPFRIDCRQFPVFFLVIRRPSKRVQNPKEGRRVHQDFIQTVPSHFQSLATQGRGNANGLGLVFLTNPTGEFLHHAVHLEITKELGADPVPREQKTQGRQDQEKFQRPIFFKKPGHGWELFSSYLIDDFARRKLSEWFQKKNF
jgi:hypothetical protein